MDAYHPRNGQPLPGRPDLPSLLADTAARQFRSPTAVIQAETALKVNARAASKPGDGAKPASFCPAVADAILSSGKPL